MRPYAAPRPKQRILGPDDSRAPVRRRAHGLSANERDALIAFQRGRCAICERPSARLEVDHDHRHCAGATGCRQCVRGLLCGRCNTALGRFGDRNVPALLRYLSR